MDESFEMSADLIFGLIRATEASAIAAFAQAGLGDNHRADEFAVKAFRESLNHIAMRGRIVIGEGERDKAPMLYIGEEVGTGAGPDIDIAVDPLEGTNLTSKYQANALAVAAFAKRDHLLHAPDVYMQKIAIGRGYPDNIVGLDRSPQDNILALAKAKGVAPSQLTICILERERHHSLIEAVRSTKARIHLISDGDIAGVIQTTRADEPIDIYMGIGGAPEGVLAAAALHCIGGQMQARLLLDDDKARARAKKMGIDDPNALYQIEDMVRGDVVFVATGVTNGNLLEGCRAIDDNGVRKWRTQSLMLHAASGEKRLISNEVLMKESE